MGLINFTNQSTNKLRGILGSYGDDFQNARLQVLQPQIENSYFKVTEEIDNGGDTEYKAIQVRVDGEVVTDGIEFDSDKASQGGDPSTGLSYFENLKYNETLFSGSIEIGKAYQVEGVTLDDSNGTVHWYIIPKGGAGGSSLHAFVIDGGTTGLPPLSQNQYYIEVSDTRSRVAPTTPSNINVLSMAYYSNYGQLPVGYYLSVFISPTGFYEPLEIQTDCFGVINNVIDSNNYEISINTKHDESGFDLGINHTIAPNIGYGLLGANSKISVKFIKELNQWYIDPSTFGAI